MTHTFYRSLLIFEYNEKVEEQRNAIVCNTLLSLRIELKEKEVRGIFISLKHSSMIKENPSLSHLVQQMDKLSQQLNLPVALGDYSKDTFLELQKWSKQTQVKLFQNLSSALLFLNPAYAKKQLTLLLFDEDKANADMLCAYLVPFGHSITHAKTMAELQQHASAKSYDMTLAQNSLNRDKSMTPIQPTLTLSKGLILNLPIFMETAAEVLSTTTGFSAEKVRHTVRTMDYPFDTAIIIASMKFKGAFGGNFFLIFPRYVAVHALEGMLGETIDSGDTQAITDGVAELCNMITGSAKSRLSQKGIALLFELPKTYLSLQIAHSDACYENGVWIEMVLNGKPFYMFITK